MCQGAESAALHGEVCEGGGVVAAQRIRQFLGHFQELIHADAAAVTGVVAVSATGAEQKAHVGHRFPEQAFHPGLLGWLQVVFRGARRSRQSRCRGSHPPARCPGPVVMRCVAPWRNPGRSSASPAPDSRAADRIPRGFDGDDLHLGHVEFAQGHRKGWWSCRCRWDR